MTMFHVPGPRPAARDAEISRDLIAETAETSILGTSPEIRYAVATARRLAKGDLPILLIGATGTGKELFAREIHRWSGRSGALVDVNCAAIPRELVEGTLYGHRKGAFSGAIESVSGLIEDANDGTLFLDELCSMPYESQGKLLRVLDSKDFRRVGETNKRKSRFRVVAAVQENVGDKVADGSVRYDLIQRVAGAVLTLPPLDQRRGDVVLLARYFAARAGVELAQSAEPVLLGYPWPGNVRELRSAIERAVFLIDESVLDGRAMAESLGLGTAILHMPNGGAPRQTAIPVTVRDRLLDVCAANDWNAERAAVALGLGRTTFFKQLQLHGISLRKERSSIEHRALSDHEPKR